MQRLVDPEHVGNALDEVAGYVADPARFPLVVGGLRRIAEKDARFRLSQSPGVRDPEERPERGGRELLGGSNPSPSATPQSPAGIVAGSITKRNN